MLFCFICSISFMSPFFRQYPYIYFTSFIVRVDSYPIGSSQCVSVYFPFLYIFTNFYSFFMFLLTSFIIQVFYFCWVSLYRYKFYRWIIFLLHKSVLLVWLCCLLIYFLILFVPWFFQSWFLRDVSLLLFSHDFFFINVTLFCLLEI